MKCSLAVALLCLGLSSCDSRLPAVPDLFVDFDALVASTRALDTTGMKFMNGVYDVVQGSSELGNPVVGKWVRNRWCIYSQHDVVFSVFAGGFLADSAVQLRGYVRRVRSGSGERVGLTIAPSEGGSTLSSGVKPPLIVLRGAMDNGTRIELRKASDLRASAFEVLAHRGGGRNSDRLGISENSIEMIKFAGILGATGVEVDVKRTRDNKLILFHDDTFSPRTVQGAYLLGNVGDYDLEQIRSLGKLIYGEQIPTLQEALTAVIDDTDLSRVWLDVKDPGEVGQVVQIQKEMKVYATAKQRGNLSILLGIPSQEVLNVRDRIQDDSEALLELKASDAIRLSYCRVWGPAWTRDIGEASAVQVAGKKVFIWTVDLRETIVNNLATVNGILSNYPSLVAAVRGCNN